MIHARLPLLGGTDYKALEAKTKEFLKAWDALMPGHQTMFVAQNVAGGEIDHFGTHTLDELNEIGMHLAETGRINGALSHFFDPLHGEILGDRIGNQNITRKRDIAMLLDPHTSQDQSRENITGVFHDAKNQMLVATDGRLMVAIPAPVSGANRVTRMRHVGAFPKGSTVDGNFPNWQAVMPKDCVEQPWDWRLAHNKLRVAMRLNACGNLALPPACFLVWLDTGGCVSVNPVFVLRCLETLVAAGAHKVRLLTAGINRQIMLEGDTGGKAVVMPLRSDKDGKYECYCPVNIGMETVLEESTDGQ